MRTVFAFLEATLLLFVLQDGGDRYRISPTRRQRLKTMQHATVKSSYDHVLEWKPPTPDQVSQTRQRILGPMKSLTSPVFFSTDSEGRRHAGLADNIMKLLSDNNNSRDNRPLLFVSNHQLVGIDSWLVVDAIQEECGFFVRSLTHPFLYPTDTPDGTSFLETYGCLPVSTRNFYRLLQSNQPILLFPGGATESFQNSREDAYKMNAWTTDKVDFIRAAAKFDATIVPFSSIGAAESAVFLNELPFANTRPLQDALRAAAGARAPISARYDEAGATTTTTSTTGSITDSSKNGPRHIDFPLVVPKPLPIRHYFLFGKPVDLSQVEYKDREKCLQIYGSVKESIQKGCKELLEASKEDPFQDPLRRVPYEQFWRRPAPTFSVDVLNKKRKR